MLVLTCRVGATLHIGDEIHVTVRARVRNRVTVGVLQPVVLPGGGHWYLFSLLGVRRFRVGDIEAGVWVSGEEVVPASSCDDFLHVGVSAPAPFRFGYEPNIPGHAAVNLGAQPMAANFWN
jgi:hypothetical protein